MKKIVLTLLSIVFSVTLMGQFTIGELTYTVIGGNNVRVKKAQSLTFVDLVIPPQVENGNTTYRVTEIEESAFYFCTNLKSASIPSTIEVIGDNAFLECQNLESITFEANSNLTNIGSYAFKNCYKLSSITIPKNVTRIGSSAFENCSALTEVDFKENSELTTIIWYSAFSSCSELKSIIIPKKVTSIKGHAFDGCSSLTSVTFLAETPPDLTNQYSVFASTPATKTLTVPFGSDYSAWESHTSWGQVNYKINAGETKTLNYAFLITDANKRKVINDGVMVIGHNGQLINATDNNIGGVIEVQTPVLTKNQWHFVGAPFNDYELEAIKPPATAQDVAVVLYDYSSGVWNNTFATIADLVSAGEGFFAWPFATESIVFKSTKDNGTHAYTLNNTPEIAVNKTLISNSNNDSWMALANPYTFKLNIATFLDDQPENTIQGGVSYRFNGTSWTIANQGEINVTEGFFVNFASAGSSTVTFKKTQRNAPSAKAKAAREFIRLSMADGESNIELLFAHNEDAEQGYDIYDANKMFATTGVSEPYFVTEGIALVKEEVKELPYYATMNVRSSESKEVKFKADYILEGLAVSIIDGEEVIDLTEGVEYATEIASGENADRFKVLIKKNVGLADVEELDVRITNSNRHIAITAQENVKVSVYNTLGQKVFETEETNFVLSGVASGAYVVKVQGAKASKSQKIIVE